MRIDIEYIYWLQRRRKEINELDLGEIQFYEEGVRIAIPKNIIKDFELTGLNNIDFITSGYYHC